MNTIVTFETAKLLKEKGFDLLCIYCYDKFDMLSTYSTVFKPLNYNTSGYLKSAPPIGDAIMWLYKKHGIWIFINQSTARLGFIAQVQRLNALGQDPIFVNGRYNEPTEAYSAAILYALNKLI